MKWWRLPQVVRVRLSVALLLERRAALFAWVDGFFLFIGLLIGLGGSSGRVSELWPAIVLMPLILLGVPMLSEVVAVERRSGTLDLALSSPGANWYFERRIAAAAILMIVQGWLLIVTARIAVEPFPLAPALVQVVTVTAFVAAVVLNWAVRLKTPGAVIFATCTTMIAFAPWVLLANPIHPVAALNRPMNALEIVQWFRTNLVLAGAAVIFYLFAAHRLSKPEAIIA